MIVESRLPRSKCPRLSRAAWVVALAVVFAPARSSAGELRFALNQIPCTDRDEIARRIEHGASAFMQGQPDLSLVVRIDASGLLLVRMVGTRSRHEVRLPFDGSDCDAFAETVLLLIQSWLARTWTAPFDPPEPPALAASAEAGPTPARTEARWSAAVLGGAFYGLGAEGSGASLSAAADWALARDRGVALIVGHQGRVLAEAGAGTISAKLWTVALAATASVRPGESTRIDLLVGPAFTLLVGRGDGFAESSDLARPDLAGFFSARFGLQVMPHLEWLVSSELQVRLHEEVLRVHGANPSLRVSRARVSFQTGVAITAF